MIVDMKFLKKLIKKAFEEAKKNGDDKSRGQESK